MRKKVLKSAVLLMSASVLMGAWGGAASAEEADLDYDSSVTLSFSFWGDSSEKAAVENVLHSFTEATGIAVEEVYVPDSYITKMATLAASNDLPDCGYFEEGYVLEWYLEGMLEDMSDVLGDLDILEECQYVSPSGETIAASIANETICLFYNKTVFDEAGIDYPPTSYEEAWTWDEFLDVCRQLTTDKNGLHPGEEGFDSSAVKTYGCKIEKAQYLIEPLLRSNGGGIYSDDGSEVILDSEESIEVLQALADMILVENVSPSEDSSVNTMDMSSAFLSNTLAMQIDGQWCLQSMLEAQEEDGIEWGVAVLPYFDKPVTGNTGTPVVMFKDSEHPVEQAMLAEYFLNPEYVINMIQSGLWQPTSKNWYEDEEYISQWVMDNFPDNYESAIIEYTLNCLQSNSWYRVAYTGEASDIWLSALDNVWNGASNAEEAIASVIDQVKTVHQKYLDLIG